MAITTPRPWFIAKLQMAASVTAITAIVSAAYSTLLGAGTGAWTAWTGTAARGTVATYTAADISASPTEAEVQAIADATQANSRAIKALIDDLKTRGILGA
jgi:hypothetical protein